MLIYVQKLCFTCFLWLSYFRYLNVNEMKETFGDIPEGDIDQECAFKLWNDFHRPICGADVALASVCIERPTHSGTAKHNTYKKSHFKNMTMSDEVPNDECSIVSLNTIGKFLATSTPGLQDNNSNGEGLSHSSTDSCFPESSYESDSIDNNSVVESADNCCFNVSSFGEIPPSERVTIDKEIFLTMSSLHKNRVKLKADTECVNSDKNIEVPANGAQALSSKKEIIVNRKTAQHKNVKSSVKSLIGTCTINTANEDVDPAMKSCMKDIPNSNLAFETCSSYVSSQSYTPNTSKMFRELESNAGQVNVLNLHKSYRVYFTGGLSLPKEDIVVNHHVMAKILHKAVRSIMHDSGSISMASRLQAYMWPVVSRGNSVFAIGEKGSGKTIGYILPLVTLLIDMWPCIVRAANTKVGPVAVIVCKGWSCVQSVGDTFAELLRDHGLRVVSTWGGLKKDSVSTIQKEVYRGADILVTTLPFLLRLIGVSVENEETSDERIQFDLLSHCFHLVIDDADIIIDHEPKAVKLLLKEWATSRAKSKQTRFSQQIIVTGSSWTTYLSELANFLTPLLEPAIIISSPIEAARACSVRSFVHCSDKSMSVYQDLGDVVDIIKTNAATKKILIIVPNNREAKQLRSLFRSVAVFSQIIHGRLLFWEMQEEVKTWGSASNGVVLIATASTIPLLLEQDLRDANILVHVHIPSNKKHFAQRFSFLMDNYTNECKGDDNAPVSYVIVDNCSKYLPGYLKESLNTLNTVLPTEMSVPFNEEIDASVPLCHFLKAYGSCPSVNLCDWRHKMLEDDITCRLPCSGIVTLEIIRILNASRYLVRVIEYRSSNSSDAIDLNNNHFTMFMALQNFSNNSDELQILSNSEVGSLCLVNHESIWARGRILHRQLSASTPEATIFLMDEGDEITVKINKLYELPEEFSKLPQLVVEVYLCKVRPLDYDTEWTHHANFFMEKLFSEAGESKFIGNVAHSMSSTMWISPLVEIIKVEGNNIKKESIRSQLIRHGFGCSNDNHIDLLKQHFMKISNESDRTETQESWLDQWKRD